MRAAGAGPLGAGEHDGSRVAPATSGEVVAPAPVGDGPPATIDEDTTGVTPTTLHADAAGAPPAAFQDDAAEAQPASPGLLGILSMTTHLAGAVAARMLRLPAEVASRAQLRASGTQPGAPDASGAVPGAAAFRYDFDRGWTYVPAAGLLPTASAMARSTSWNIPGPAGAPSALSLPSWSAAAPGYAGDATGPAWPQAPGSSPETSWEPAQPAGAPDASGWPPDAAYSGQAAPASPAALPERPWEATDAELARVIASLPPAMADAAIAAGVLGPDGAPSSESAGPMSFTHAAGPFGPSWPSSPAVTEASTQAGLGLPDDRAGPGASAFPGFPALPGQQALSELQAAGGTRRAGGPAPLDLVLAPAAFGGASGQAWSDTGSWATSSGAFSETAGATAGASGGIDGFGSNGGLPAGGAGGALAGSASGVAMASVQRALTIEDVAGPALELGGDVGGGDENGTDGEDGHDLDRLADEVFDILRWRLAAERERMLT
ncbi:MAG: hypothetical protein ACRDJN_02130 [Chloroflexota bacterium]